MTNRKITIAFIIMLILVYKPLSADEGKNPDSLSGNNDQSNQLDRSVNNHSLLDGFYNYPVNYVQAGKSSGPGTDTPLVSSNERSSRFAIYGTLGGYTLVVGLGVEYLFTDWLGLNVNVGGYRITTTSYYSNNKTTTGVFAVPILLSFYLGKGKKRFYFEGGVGFYDGDGLSNTDSIIGNQSSAKAIFGLGFNLFPLNGGFYLKAGASFIVTGGGRDGVGLWTTRPVFFMPRVSLGYAFLYNIS